MPRPRSPRARSPAAAPVRQLRELRGADAGLFSPKYPTWCMASRLPVVVTPAELARFRPGSHSGALSHGSTAAKKAANRYVCPQVWCPESRTPLTKAQLKAQGGRCPGGARDVPVVFKDGARHPGLLEGRFHPKGLAAPCCFKKAGVRSRATA